jgi:hypothetical protein
MFRRCIMLAGRADIAVGVFGFRQLRAVPEGACIDGNVTEIERDRVADEHVEAGVAAGRVRERAAEPA